MKYFCSLYAQIPVFVGIRTFVCINLKDRLVQKCAPENTILNFVLPFTNGFSLYYVVLIYVTQRFIYI